MNRQQLNAFNALVHWSTMLQYGYDSSSKNFDERLREMGVVPPVKLHYEYRFPNAKSGQEYDRWVQRLVYMLAIYHPDQILDPVKYYTDGFRRGVDFYQGDIKFVANVEAQKSISQIYNVSKYLFALTDQERKELVQQIEADTPKAHDAALEHYNKLKELNPELQFIQLDVQKVALLDFLQGVAYGFAPEDIDYFVNSTDIEKRNREIDPYTDYLGKLGVRPTYVVRPDRLEKIVNAVQRVKATQEITNGKTNG